MPLSPVKPSGQDLLRHACKVLGLVDGCLLPASSGPSDENRAQWTDKGDWLALAHQLKAQQVFFVENEPLLVLAELPAGENETRFFNKIWCMARPHLLFFAREGELAVYQLSKAPVGKDEKLGDQNRCLALAHSVAEIQEKLGDFRRELLESGRVFGDERFGTGALRADRALVHDLKIVRRLLLQNDELSPAVVHALIGRAIFVRYLEARNIIVREYFETIATTNAKWSETISDESIQRFAEPEFENVLFFRVLKNREFTYAFFDKLAEDFNGDTFPVTAEERRTVKSKHLALLRQLLTGDSILGQPQLFLFAYQFDVIPIELISSIYEEFYTAYKDKDNTQSTYYTPPALVDFLLARVLTNDVLDTRPRVADAACGSGIFLVETFRRMVRHRVWKQGRRLSPRELRCILRDQLAGIDLNPEAVPVAAFSLYLAYLHYQEPREINEERTLPNLRWNPKRGERNPDQHFDILYSGNAFEAVMETNPVLREHFGPESANVVVGNPPWGEVKKKDTLGRTAVPGMKAWLSAMPERVIGDNELSQAFVHLALELLRDGGKAALLLSSGVLFKQHENSRAFRSSWLTRCKLQHLVNFAHVRHLYFSEPARDSRRGSKTRSSDGTSPFVSVVFQKGKPEIDHRFTYWSAKRTAEVENSRSIIISRADMHRLNQSECLRNESLWKIYWWGSRRDDGLIRTIERFPSFINLGRVFNNVEILPGRGFEELNGPIDADWLREYKELPVRNFHRYGKIDSIPLTPVPDNVYRRGTRDVYEGHRFLIKRGIGNERVVSRLETTRFCFRNSILAFKLHGLSMDEEAIILGINWSSLAVYYYWMVAGSWGFWHDELHSHLVGRLPIALRRNPAVSSQIVNVVAELRKIDPLKLQRINELEAELDEAVFDLYELNSADRDLVRDMCLIGLDFFYRRSGSDAVRREEIPKVTRGLASELPRRNAAGITGYLQVFLQMWNAELEPESELEWEIIEGPPGTSIIAVTFSTVVMGQRSATFGLATEWATILKQMAKRSLVPADSRALIYTDTFVRAVNEPDGEMLIVKRNERRFWTRSMAREDADATIAQAMRISEKSP